MCLDSYNIDFYHFLLLLWFAESPPVSVWFDPWGEGAVFVVRDQGGAWEEWGLPVLARQGRTTCEIPTWLPVLLSCFLSHSDCVSSLHQLYSHIDPPVVRVSSGPVFSDITSCFRHFTHRVRLYHVDGNDVYAVHVNVRPPDPLCQSKLQTTLMLHRYYKSVSCYLSLKWVPESPNPKSVVVNWWSLSNHIFPLSSNIFNIYVCSM